MNEDNNVITMDCESVAVLLQKMRKESKWLSDFGKLPSAIGWGAIPDGQGSGGAAPREPPHLAGIPQQQDIAFYPAGRKGALSGIGTARSVGSKL